MKKYSLIFGLLFVVPLLTGCFSTGNTNKGDTPSGGDVTPIGPEEHVHTFSDEWEYDETYHWHESTCGHDVVSGKEIHHLIMVDSKKPSETEEGYIVYRCGVCDYSYTETINKLEHVHTENDRTKEEVAPTCTKSGYSIVETYCETCGEILNTRRVELDPLGHNIVQVPASPADCQHPGHNAYEYCTRCDYTTIQEIPPTGHEEGDRVRVNEVAATCTEEGSYDENVYCKHCTNLITIEHHTTPALGHDLVHHEETDSTCTTHGHNAYDSCTRCDYTTIEEKDLLPHHIWLRTDMQSYPSGRTAGKYRYYWRCYDCNQPVRSGKDKATGSSLHLKFAGTEYYHDINLIVGDNISDIFTNTSEYETEWLVQYDTVLEINENNDVIAKAAGVSMLWAYTQGYEIASVRIHVSEDQLKLKLPQNDFYPGDNFKMDFEVYTRKNRSLLSWSSSNEEIATVDSEGNVTVNGVGEVSITATCSQYNLEDTITFTSKKHFAVLKRSEVEIGREESDNIFERVSRISIINWTSSDPNIATANGNMLSTGDRYGTATLTARSEYLDEDIVLTVHVVKVSATLSKTNYKDYVTVTFELYEVSASLGYDWHVKATIDYKGLWVPITSVAFNLEFSFSNPFITNGTDIINVIIPLGGKESSSTYVMARSQNYDPLTDCPVKPTYEIYSVYGTVEK